MGEVALYRRAYIGTQDTLGVEDDPLANEGYKDYF